MTVDELASKIKKGKVSTHNVDRITEQFNLLSDLALFLVLFCKTNEKRIKCLEYILELIDHLIADYNYNSAFALYAGIIRSPLDRVKKLIINKISKKHKRMLNTMQFIFNAD